MKKRKLSLSMQIFIAMLAGAAIGAGIQLLGNPEWATANLVNGLFHVVGQIFVRLLKMLVVPLVFVSLVTGASALSNPSELGRVGGKAVGLYLMTTAVAVTLAVTAAVLFKPGVGAQPEELQSQTLIEQPPVSEVVINMIPDNPVASMADGKMLPIIFFSILLGVAITMSGGAGRNIRQFFENLNEVIMKLVTIVMKVAPIGVFALIAKMAATSDMAAIAKVGKYMLLVFSMLILHAVVVYPTLLTVFTKLNPLIFFYKMRAAMLFAFSVSSSNATIPVTLESVEKRVGVGNKIASFIVPLGATVNMDGTAIMQGIAAGFIAQYFGIDLSIGQYITIILMVIMASIGTAGVPSVGLIMLAGVLLQIGMPEAQIGQGIAIVFAVDRILDMTRTVVNITGDATVTTIVAKSEGELNLETYNDRTAGLAYERGEALPQTAD